MSKSKIFITLFLFAAVAGVVTGCAFLSNTEKNIEGSLIGLHFNIGFYDNYGENILNLQGSKVSLKSNYVKTKSIDSDGSSGTTWEPSSVVTITIDGSQVAQTGNTVIFAEDGIKELENFEMPQNITTSGGSVAFIDRNINDIKNVLGTPKIIVVCSQLGSPIAVYGGSDVYWDVPSDLPKTTKLNIDGKALYIHRANYILFDSDIIY